MASCGAGCLIHVEDALLGRVDDGEGEARPLGGDLAGFAWMMVRVSRDQASGVGVTPPLV